MKMKHLNKSNNCSMGIPVGVECSKFTAYVIRWKEINTHTDMT